MRSIIEIAELAGLLGLTFSFAVIVEWALLRGIFKTIAAGLEPAVNRIPESAARKAQR